MSLNWKQFEYGVLRPTLSKLQPVIPTTEVATRLVGETIWHESDRLQALGQYPREGIGFIHPFGPGLGPPSMEAPTWLWLNADFIGRRSELAEVFYAATGLNFHVPQPDGFYGHFAWNLALGVAGCRLRYFVDRRKLPELESGIEGRADYWFKVYNASGIETRKAKYIKDAKELDW